MREWLALVATSLLLLLISLARSFSLCVCVYVCMGVGGCVCEHGCVDESERERGHFSRYQQSFSKDMDVV